MYSTIFVRVRTIKNPFSFCEVNQISKKIPEHFRDTSHAQFFDVRFGRIELKGKEIQRKKSIKGGMENL